VEARLWVVAWLMFLMARVNLGHAGRLLPGRRRDLGGAWAASLIVSAKARIVSPACPTILMPPFTLFVCLLRGDHGAVRGGAGLRRGSAELALLLSWN